MTQDLLRSEDDTMESGMVREIPSLRAFARTMCGDAVLADDLVQETLMRAWTYKDRFELGTNLRAWLFRILRNQFYTHLRKHSRMSDMSAERIVSLTWEPPNQYGPIALKEFQKALAQIPVEQREALILVAATGYSYEEAAQICQCAVGTIKSRISRARTLLHELMGEDAAELTGGSDNAILPILLMRGPDEAAAA